MEGGIEEEEIRDGNEDWKQLKFPKRSKCHQENQRKKIKGLKSRDFDEDDRKKGKKERKRERKKERKKENHKQKPLINGGTRKIFWAFDQELTRIDKTHVKAFAGDKSKGLTHVKVHPRGVPKRGKMWA